MSDQSNPGAAFVAGGAVTGAGVASTGNIGLVGSFGGAAVTTFPLIGVGAVTGAAVYGAWQGLSEGDAVALGAFGLGAIGGAVTSATVGGIGVAGSFGAFGVGMGLMTTAGGVVGLGIYGLAKLLERSGSQEPAAQAFARMESKILWQEAYTAALIELDEFLSGEELKRKFFVELEIDAELQQLKTEVQRQKSRNAASRSELQRINQEIPQPVDLKQQVPLGSAGVWLQTHSLNHHAGSINAIAISPDGQTVATGGDDRTIILWNLNTGNRLYTFFGQRGAVLSVAISPDGQALVGGGLDQTIINWKIETKYLLNTFLPTGSAYSHASFIYSVAFSPDGKTLVSGSADHTIRVWRYDYRSFVEKLKRTLTGHTDTVFSVAIATDNQTLISGSADKTIRIWDLLSWRQSRVLTGHSGWVNCVAVSPDGQIIVSGSTDTTLKLWNLKTGELLYTLTGHSGAIISLAFSPDGQMFASSSKDGTIRLWQLQSEQLQSEGDLPIKRLHTLLGQGRVLFSPDGKTLICGCENGLIKVWQQLSLD